MTPPPISPPPASAPPHLRASAPPPSTIADRPDLRVIVEMIPAGSKVLDLGCGDGLLLDYLISQRQVRGRGIELSEEGVLACVRRGLSVRQGNLQEGLADYPNHSFDYVVLSQTLPFLDDPGRILTEMLRVGKRAIVSLPNWGYWRHRLNLLLTGRIPVARDLGQAWHQSPRWQAITVTDFAHFCPQIGIAITQQAYLANKRRIQVRKFKNLMATTAIFVLEKV